MTASGTSRFEYRGWEVQICLRAATATDLFAFAELNFQGRLVTRLDLPGRLDARTCSWSLSTRACDFIDAWCARQLPAEDLKHRELVLGHAHRGRRGTKCPPLAWACSDDKPDTAN